MQNFIIRIIGFGLNVLSFFSTKKASKIAFRLFASPRNTTIKPKGVDFLKTATQKQFNYNDTSIMSYHWEGQNDTVLLVHGWESNSSRWKKLIKKLRDKDYNIIALDAPAHGNTSGKFFNAILYSECINIVAEHFSPKIIIGHSVGGMATIFFQHKHKLKSVEKLVLLGAPSSFSDIFDRYLKMMHYNTEIKKGLYKIIVERFKHPPSYFSSANFAKDISAKGLLIHDINDSIIPYDDALDYQKNYANSELIKTSGLGHGLNDKTVNQHIIDFITS